MDTWKSILICLEVQMYNNQVNYTNLDSHGDEEINHRSSVLLSY
jgi:hypothetical protein